MTWVNCAPTKNFSPNTRFGVDARTGIAYIKQAAFEQCFGWVAQLVEQGTENPRVRGSIPFPATRNTRAATFGLRPFLVSGQLRAGHPARNLVQSAPVKGILPRRNPFTCRMRAPRTSPTTTSWLRSRSRQAQAEISRRSRWRTRTASASRFRARGLAPETGLGGCPLPAASPRWRCVHP